MRQANTPLIKNNKILLHKTQASKLRLNRLTLSLFGTALISVPIIGFSATPAPTGGNYYDLNQPDYCAITSGNDYIGVCNKDGDANDANVVNSGTNTFDNLVGGASTAGNIKNNTVTLESGTVNETVYGGYTVGTPTQSVSLENNTVIITGGTVKDGVFGAYTEDGNVIGNIVTINDDTAMVYIEDQSGVAGGTTDKGQASNNQVTVSTTNDQVTIDTVITGGYTYEGIANNNTVTINGGNIDDDIIGGGSNSGEAKDNKIYIYDGLITGNVYGGHSEDSANTTDNSVIISGGNIFSDVYGGYTLSGNANENIVTISGGIVDATIMGGFSATGDATSNVVNISGGIVGTTIMGGFSATGDATGNVVNISENDNQLTSAADGVLGGYSGAGLANKNIVNIYSGQIIGNIAGGYSDASNAIDNTINIHGGDINKNIYGGYSSLGNANNNTINIMGGNILSDEIIGGNSETNGAKTTNNHIIISGAPVFGANTLIAGSNQASSITGNTLSIHSKNITASNVDNFENYNFHLPKNIQNNDQVLILTSAYGTDISDSKVGIDIEQGHNLKQGDRVALVHNSQGGVNSDNVEQISITSNQGISLKQAFSLSKDAENLYATISKTSLRDQTKAPVEGRIGALAMVLQGADTAASTGMDHITEYGNGLFGTISGGSSKYKSGSHVDVDGVNLMLGYKKHFDTGAGNLATGVFFEAGWGHHKTHNSFSSHKVKGSGNSDYYGLGLLARHNWDSGLYAEASVRGGRIKSDWSTSDMGQKASYDISSPYYGAHLGLGYLWQLNQKTELDLYAKYLWSHLGSKNTDIAGDPYKFKKIDSQRTRLGARVNYQFNDNMTAYVGAAWEREYDSRARATVYDLSTASPSIKGNTGVFELGMDITPSVNSPFNLGLGLQAYAGKRQGVSGTLNAEWQF